MTFQIPFLKKLNEDFFKEDYKTYHIQIFAIKSDFRYVILFMKIELSNKSEKIYELIESFDQEGVILEEFITEDILLERIKKINEELVYDLGEIKFTFFKDIFFPDNYADFLKEINTSKQKYLKISVRNPINFIYLSKLYDLKSFLESGPIDLRDNSIFEQSYMMKNVESFNEKKFVLYKNLLLGRDLLEKYFSSYFQNWLEPKLLIIFPIKTINVEYNYQKTNDTTLINVIFSIPEDWKDNVKPICGKRSQLLKPSDNKLTFSVEKDFSGFIDVLIIWKGTEELIPIDSRIYWRQIHIISFNENTYQEISVYEQKKNELERLIELESDTEVNKKIFDELSEVIRLLRIRYESIHISGIYDYSKKIEELIDKRIAIFKIIANKIEGTDKSFKFDFRYYLKYNNLLFQKYEKILNEQEQLYLNGYIQKFQVQDNPEAVEMKLNIRKSISNVIEIIHDLQRKNDTYNLVDLLEILGDLYVHQGLLDIITSEQPLSNLHHNFVFQNAIESYQKAVKKIDEISIPGVGRGSIRVANYMQIFNKFSTQGEVQSKKDYIKTLINYELEDYKKNIIVLYDTPNQGYFLKTGFFESRLQAINGFIELFNTPPQKITKLTLVNDKSLSDNKAAISYLEQDVNWTLIYTVKQEKRTDIDPKLTSIINDLASLTSHGWDIIFLITKDKGLIQSVLSVPHKELFVVIQPEDTTLNSTTYLKRYKPELYHDNFQIFKGI